MKRKIEEPESEFCVLYTRVSTVLEVQQKSLEHQLSRLETYAKFKGLTVKGVFSDSSSGREIDNRPGFLEALSKMKRGYTFLTCSLSRFSRNLANTLKILEDFKEKGFFLICLDMDINTKSAMGKMMISLGGAFAELESGTTSERVIYGMTESIKNGGQCGRPAYGWKKGKIKGKFEPDDVEQAAITLMLNMREEGYTLNEIINELDDRGFIPRYASNWTLPKVSKIITYYS